MRSVLRIVAALGGAAIACGDDGGGGPRDAARGDAPSIDAPPADAATVDAPGDSGVVGPRRIAVARAGVGVGVVTSEPPGIVCDTECDAVLDGEVVLIAEDGYASTFTGWSLPSCGAAARCTIPAGADPGTVTATFASTADGSIRIEIAGDGVGEVDLYDPNEGSLAVA